MKRLFIIAIIGVAGFLTYHYIKGTGPFGNKTMVAYGSSVFEEGTGVQHIELHGIFDAQDYIEPGQPTIIEFYTDICIGCRQLHDHYKQFLKLRPDVAVQQIRLDRYWKPQDLWEAHEVRVERTPHIVIYAPDGKLIAEDEGKDKSGFEFLYKWMNHEIKEDWKRRKK